MKTVKDQMSISFIKYLKDSGKLNNEPIYQRKPDAWNNSKKQLLIDTILSDYDMPKFYLRDVKNDSSTNFEYELVDGQQRIHAIMTFIENEFELSNDTTDPAYAAKKWADIPTDVQRFFLDGYRLSVTIVEDATEMDIEELFQRLQRGTSLNSAEKRNAINGALTIGIRELADNHPITQLINLKKTRYFHHEVIAICGLIESKNGPSAAKFNELYELYTGNRDLKDANKILTPLKSNLNTLMEIIQLRTEMPELGKKWVFIDFYICLKKVKEEYVINNTVQKELGDFIVSWEQTRTEKEYEEFDDDDAYESAIKNYIFYFNKGGDQEAITKRHEAMFTTLLNEIPLTPKDPNRLYNKYEKIALWRNAEEKCEICNTKIPFADMNADHKIAHSKGGTTSLVNGMSVCQFYNKAKGNRETPGDGWTCSISNYVEKNSN